MFFSLMKEKSQKAYRIKSYDEVLTNILISMLVYRNYPEELTNCMQFVEIYRIIEGAAAIFKYEGKYVVGHVNFGGKPDHYGIGMDAICSLDDGIVITFEDWRNNPEVGIFFCNSTFMPDMSIGRFSDAFAELEVSLKLNVLFSRMYPIPVASDNKTKTAIEDSIKNAMDGKISTILSPDALAKYVDGATSTGIETVNLTDVEKSRYIQYLAKYRDDLLRWFLSQYGMNSQGSSKLAQQTVDEVNQDNNASMIIPHDMLRQAQYGCDMCNDKFGWNLEVSFSECWQSRLANMDDEFKTTDEELEETTEEEPTEETTEEETTEETTEVENEKKDTE